MPSKHTAPTSLSKTKLKIGFVLDDSLDKPDGVQQYILALGAWLTHEGHEVHYLVGQTTRTDLANVHSLSRNVGVRFNGNRMSVPLPASRRKIRKLLDAEQFDVLHVQMPYSPLMAGRIIAAAKPNTAVVGTFHILPHSGLAHIATSLLGLWSRTGLKRFDEIVSVSQPAVEFAEQTFNATSTVLPNVVDIEHFAVANAPQSGSDKVCKLVFLGRLVPRKGCQVLLEALTLLPNDVSVELRVCGAGPLEPTLRQYATEHNLNNVHFMGFVTNQEKANYLAEADIAIFPSSGGESFGIVLIEAMAAGRPVVLGGDNPGYRSVLAERPELLFAPKNVQELSQKIAHFASDKQARTAAVIWQNQHVKQFAVSSVGQKLVGLYRRALHKRFGVR